MHPPATMLTFSRSGVLSRLHGQVDAVSSKRRHTGHSILPLHTSPSMPDISTLALLQKPTTTTDMDPITASGGMVAIDIPLHRSDDLGHHQDDTSSIDVDVVSTTNNSLQHPSSDDDDDGGIIV
jgi:hypothetical protein